MASLHDSFKTASFVYVYRRNCRKEMLQNITEYVDEVSAFSTKCLTANEEAAYKRVNTINNLVVLLMM
jgi:hypothetical protein